MSSHLDDVCDQLKSIFAEKEKRISELNNEVERLRTQFPSIPSTNVESSKDEEMKKQISDLTEELTRLRTEAPKDNGELMTKCQQQEQTITQLQSQFAGVKEVIEKYEMTITNMNVHVKFTTWMQQAHPQHMSQFFTLFQQSQSQPQVAQTQ